MSAPPVHWRQVGGVRVVSLARSEKANALDRSLYGARPSAERADGWTWALLPAHGRRPELSARGRTRTFRHDTDAEELVRAERERGGSIRSRVYCSPASQASAGRTSAGTHAAYRELGRGAQDTRNQGCIRRAAE